MEAAVTGASSRSDRRCEQRLERLEAHRIRSARIRPGHGAIVINVSAAGVLLETMRRLLPGSVVEVQMETETDRTIVRGRVLRCAVSQLRAAGIAYRGAVLFDHHLPWFVEDRKSVV